MSSRSGFPTWWPDQQREQQRSNGCWSCSCSGLMMGGRCLATQHQYVNHQQPHHSYCSLPPQQLPPAFYTNGQIDNIALYPLLFRPGPVPASNLNINYSYSAQFNSMEGSEEHAPHDMAAQQEAAKEYRPEIQGPEVGPRTPSSTITEEYAKADPIYIEKTTALSKTYSYYRPVKGDGNCGWRAIAFSYYEKLAMSGDSSRIGGEVARLTSMNQMLETVGQYTYYEDWADEAIGLLRDMATQSSEQALQTVSERWNDIATSSALIYYFRLLAATYLKANADAYDPFVPDGSGIQSYCAGTVEPVDREIDQLGIIALANVLLKPAELCLEIAYLDRTPGTQPNVYRFPEEDSAAALPENVIYLLFRPDHYDILYREPSPPSSAAMFAFSNQALPTQVNRATDLFPADAAFQLNTDLRTFSTADLSCLAGIPDFSYGAPPQQLPNHNIFEQHQQACSTLGNGDDWAGAPVKEETPVSYPTPAASPLECNIRFTALQLDYDDNMPVPDASYNVTTSTFKNSIWNRAHFGNPDFHPEEWSPEGEASDSRMGHRRRARRGAS